MFSCGSWFTSSSSEQNSAAAPATATESVGLLQRLKDSAPLNLLLFPAPPAEPLAVRRRAAAAEGMAAPELDDVVPLYLPPYGDPVYLMPCPGAQQAQGAMLYFHGNGCDAEMMLVYGQDLRQLAVRMKCHLLFVEYPGYGCCAGAPSETSCLRTAQQAFAFVRDKLRVPSERIMVFGTSIGGGVAVELAARLAAAATGRLRGLILQCTFTSIRRLGLDLGVPRWSSYLFQDRFDNQTRLQQCDPNTPVYLFHGARDELIPPQHSQQLLDCSPARHKRLLVVPGATHAYFPTTSWMTDCCRFFEEDVPTLKDVPLPPPLPANVAELAMPAPTAEALEQRYEAQRRQSEASANRVRSLEGVMQGIARAMMRIAGWFP